MGTYLAARHMLPTCAMRVCVADQSAVDTPENVTLQLTKWGAKRKAELEDGYKEAGERGASQVRARLPLAQGSLEP